MVDDRQKSRRPVPHRAVSGREDGSRSVLWFGSTRTEFIRRFCGFAVPPRTLKTYCRTRFSGLTKSSIGFHGDSSFYTWLYRIAVNLALKGDRRKRRVPGRIAPRDGVGSARPGRGFEVSDPSLPLQNAERERLDSTGVEWSWFPNFGAVVVLEGSGRPAVRRDRGRKLGIPVGVPVRSRLHRARSRAEGAVARRGGRSTPASTTEAYTATTWPPAPGLFALPRHGID